MLFLGLLCGAPYGAAIVGGWGDEPVRAWKLAHMEGVQNGLAPEGPLANWVVFVAFMFGMWGVLIAVPLAAGGARGGRVAQRRHVVTTVA